MLSKEDRNNLIIINKNLVPFVANKYFKKYYKTNFFEDLISEGYVGLIKAADSFDPNKNTKFSTWAATCIINNINYWLRKNKQYSILKEISLETKVDSEDDIFLKDLIADEIDIENDYIDIETFNLESDALQRYLLASNEQIRKIFDATITGKKQVDIADEEGIHQSSVSRIIKRNIPKIQNKVYFNNNTNGSPKRSDYNSYEEYSKAFREWFNRTLDNI